MRTTFLAFAALLSAPALSLAADFYVSPNGSSGNNGSINSPWDIRTACAPASAVHPGDTVWIRGGSYGSGGTSTIACSLGGNSSSPVIIRQYPGERATLQGGIGIYGNYAWYWGLEISNNWTRSTGECGSFPSIKAADAVFFSQGVTGVKLINMVIHDAANGISDQQEASGTEDYGNILYNNGWASSCDRGHGHALYMQNNDSTVKLVQENIGFNSYDIGMQAYGGSANVSNLWFIGNVFFNNGVPGGHRVDNIFVGGGANPKQNILFQDNVAYNPLDASPGEAGYNEAINGSNIDLTLKNNYWLGPVPTGYVTLMLNGWQSTNVTGNMFVGPLSLSNIGSYNWSGNSYFKSSPPSADGGSPVSGSYPTGVKVMVRPNKYEKGRAHIIVLNFDKGSTVSVDLSNSGLSGGQSYEIRDAQNFYGSPVVTGTYNGGSITLPMTQTSTAQMINYTTPPHTSSEFGVFVVLPTSGSTSSASAPAPPPTPTLSVGISVSPSSATLNAGQTQQLAASVSGTNNTAVSWSLSPSMGSISSGGVYTAPGSVSSQQSVTVTATSQADGSKSASAKITVNPVATAAPPTTPTASAPGGMSGTWSFDAGDLSGSTVLDRSGNGLNGVLVNATPVAGKVNEALSFNGSNSAVAINSNSKLDLINSMTISAWIKTTNTSRTEDFLGKYDASAMEWGYILKTLPSGVIALRVGGNNSSGSRDVADTTPINDGQWHHVAVVINLGSNVQFYIDGTLRTTQGLATKASGTSAPLWIGTLPFNYFGAPFTGSLDSVRIDAQALSASTISSIMGNTVSVVTSPSTTPPPSSAPATSSGSGAAGSWSFDNGDVGRTSARPLREWAEREHFGSDLRDGADQSGIELQRIEQLCDGS
jgi:hypothetical protein